MRCLSVPYLDMIQKKRIDELLVARGLAESLAAARALVMAGKVIAADQRVEKSSQLYAEDTPLRVKGESRFVSRAGEKLQGIIEDLDLGPEFADRIILDIGASTGGFTQCCLEAGAARVIAVDVGTNQLAWSLRGHDRVEVFENTDIRNLPEDVGRSCDVVVADVSFNSLARLMPDIRRVAPSARLFVLLVKPQFELMRHEVPDGGVVEDEVLRSRACELVSQAGKDVGLTLRVRKDARLAGRSGNREIFLIFDVATEA